MRKYLQNEKGFAMIFIAVALVVLLGFTALAIDVGLLVSRKSTLQKACDAAALAGAQELPDDTSSADTIARQYMMNNGATNQTNLIISFEESNYKIIVNAQEQVQFLFAKVLGISQGDVNVRAAALVGEVNTIFEGSGLRPFAVALKDSDEDGYPDEVPDYLAEYKDENNTPVFKEDDDDDGNGYIDGSEDDPDFTGYPYEFTIGNPVTLRHGTDSGYSGNYALLALDDRGGDLEEQIIYGCRTPYSIFDDIITEPGLDVGIVNRGFNALTLPVEFTVPIVYSLQIHVKIEDDSGDAMPIIECDNGTAIEESVTGRKAFNIVGFAKILVDKYQSGQKLIKGTFLEEVTAGAPGSVHSNYGVTAIKLVD